MSGDSAEAIAKLVVAAGALTLTAGLAWYNSSLSSDKIKAIDSGPSIVFNSVAECLSHEKTQSACKASHGIAHSDTNSLGTRLSYSFRSTCEKKHGTPCDYHYRKNGSFYTPVMIAWQAREDDIKIAVPLYGTQMPGQYMRTDKKIIPAAIPAVPVPSPEGRF